MVSKRILHIDENHPCLLEGLSALGFVNDIAYEIPREEIEKNIASYEGIVLRSRFPINRSFLEKAKSLKFIARVGAGLENIDVLYAENKGIHLLAAPEGNRNAVGEHALGMLLSILNKLRQAHLSIQSGNWLREAHRGWELEGKTIGLIGYGNTGKSFAEKLKGFKVKVLCYDIKADVGDENALQVSLQTLQEHAHVLSLHIPQSQDTHGMINTSFIAKMQHPFWFLNTARGKAVVTDHLVEGLRSGKILGAGLDVLEFETSSFQSIFSKTDRPASLDYLLHAENVLLSPHVAGWTFESHRKLAETIVSKVKLLYP